MYVDQSLFFAAMEKCGVDMAAAAGQQNGQVDKHAVLKSFVDQWFADMDCFVGLHESGLSFPSRPISMATASIGTNACFSSVKRRAALCRRVPRMTSSNRTHSVACRALALAR